MVFQQDARPAAKQADEEVQTEDAVELIDLSAHEPRRIPSKKWRELIKKVWEADPLWCRRAHGKCASFRSRQKLRGTVNRILFALHLGSRGES
jgi:hypothetical protein